MTPKQDNRECPMTRNTRSGSIDHMCQVDTRKELLDQLLAELALHERIGSNHANIASRLPLITIDSKVKEAFSKDPRRKRRGFKRNMPIMLGESVPQTP